MRDDEERWAAIEALHAASHAWARACARDPADAEDILQAVYEKIATGRARFDGRSSLKTWLFGVIRWTAVEHARRWRLRSHRPTPPPAPPSPEDDAMSGRIARALVRALASLPERQRQVVHLVFYEDLTVDEAAGAMGVSVGTARVHYDRAKTKLATLLAGVEMDR